MDIVSDESEPLEKEVRIAARPETIFSFLTDPEKMTRWKGKRAFLDPRPGGIYRVDINGRNIARGEYVEVVPYSRVVFTWGWEGDSSPLPPGRKHRGGHSDTGRRRDRGSPASPWAAGGPATGPLRGLGPLRAEAGRRGGRRRSGARLPDAANFRLTSSRGWRR